MYILITSVEFDMQITVAEDMQTRTKVEVFDSYFD